MTVGVSYLAAMHKRFPVETAQRSYDRLSEPALALLWGTFGKRREFVRWFMQEHPKGTVLVYLTNEWARENNLMRRGELFRNLDLNGYNEALRRPKKKIVRALQKRTLNIKRLLERHKEQHKLILTLGLEDHFTSRAVRNLISITREVWPYALCRNKEGTVDPGRHYGSQSVDYIELHDSGAGVQFTDPERGIYCNDGLPIYFGDGATPRGYISPSSLCRRIERASKAGGIGLAWFREAQGATGDSRDAPPPRRRRPEISLGHSITVNRILRRHL